MPVGLAELALPIIPAVGEETLYQPVPQIPSKANGGLDMNVTIYSPKNSIIGENFLRINDVVTISVIDPAKSEATIANAIQRTRDDRFKDNKDARKRIIAAPENTAEILREQFPELTIVSPFQFDGLIQENAIQEKYGVEFTDEVTSGMLYLGALLVDRLILTKARRGVSAYNHVYFEDGKIKPAAIKPASLMAIYPEDLLVQKTYGKHPFLAPVFQKQREESELVQMLETLDFEASGNFLAQRGLVDHTPISTKQQELVTLIVAAEYAYGLKHPLGNVKEMVGGYFDPFDAEKSADYAEFIQILQDELYSKGLRLIDAQAKDFQRINERLRKSERAANLGQLLPDPYTLIVADKFVDRDNVDALEGVLYSRRHARLAGMGTRQKTLGMRGIEMTVLPKEPRLYTMGYPTFGRWETSLPNAVGTIVDALEREGLSQDSAIFIADSTPGMTLEERAQAIKRYFEMSGYIPPIPIYIFTKESQDALIDEVVARTGIDKPTVVSIIGGGSCGGNREKLAVVNGAYVMGTNNQTIFGLMDDDLELHPDYERAKGWGDKPNSQVIIDEGMYRLMYERQRNGSIKHDFLSIPGKTLAELRSQFPGMPAAQEMKDTMNLALDDAQELGVSVLDVSPTGNTITDARAWGVSIIKYKRPDYRTIKVARDYLLHEFPPTELSMLSYPAGPNQPFAYRTTKTNVDLALSAWAENDETLRFPVSFLVSKNISLQNLFKTVEDETRADNEGQPGELEVIYSQTGLSYAYVTGTALRAEHHRESSGYRPSMIRQACTSLVDNLYAQAANELISYKSGQPMMDDKAIDEYSIPEERARGVYRQLQELAQIASNKIMELSTRSVYGEKVQVTKDHIERYQNIIAELRLKLGVAYIEEKTDKKYVISEWDNVAFNIWKEEIDKIGRKQLHYHNGDLKHRLEIMGTVRKIIDEGKYPVAKVILDSDQAVSTPGMATTTVS